MDDLKNIEDFGEERAQLVIEHHDRKGGFNDWSELKEIPGFSDRMTEVLQERFSP